MNNLLQEIKERAFSKYKKDSWEIKSIGEIALDIVSGNGVTREQLGTGDCPAVKCGDINSSLPLQFKECISFVDPDLIKKPKYFERGDILISKMSNKVETVGTVRLYLGNDKCLLGGDVEAIKHNQNPKYLSFVLSTENVKQQIENLVQESTVFHLYTKNIKQIQIPLPPLEIQDEIVEFLDRFMGMERELKKELEKELERRKIQYEYYRDLVFERGINKENWEFKTIGEIALEIISGNEITKAQMGTGDYPAVRIKEIYDSKLKIEECINFVDPNLIKRKKYSEYGDILLASTSENLRDFGKACVYLGKEKCLVGNDIKIIKHNQNPKYLAYSFSTSKFQKEIKKCAEGGNVLHLYSKKLLQIKVPVPPLEIQNEIAEKLDKLHKIISDIKEGIPFLIQKNKEQYNYYKEIILEK